MRMIYSRTVQMPDERIAISEIIKNLFRESCEAHYAQTIQDTVRVLSALRA
jgi:hypothetical protein